MKVRQFGYTLLWYIFILCGTVSVQATNQYDQREVAQKAAHEAVAHPNRITELTDYTGYHIRSGEHDIK